MEREEMNRMTAREVLESEKFMEKMRSVMELEVAGLRTAAMEARRMGARISRTPLDSLRDRGVWVPEQMVELYMAVICKALVGFSSSERRYIRLVGMEAYRLTLLWMKEHN